MKTLGVVGGLLAGLVLGTALAAVFSATPPALAQVQKPAAPAPAASKPQDTKKAQAEQRLKLARLALGEVDNMYRNGRVESDTLALWERRYFEALQASGLGKGELVSALEEYLERTKNMSEVAKARFEASRTSHATVLDWQYRVLEAEMWLNEAKSR